MSFDERVDVVDLILKVLKEHEKNLDTLVTQLNLATHQSTATQSVIQGISKYKVTLRKWSDFKEKCIKSELIAFNLTDDKFSVQALKCNSLYLYSETVPEITIRIEKEGDSVKIEGSEFYTYEDPTQIFNGKLQCGLGVRTRKASTDLVNGVEAHKIVYDIDVNQAQSWLSDELKTDKKQIINGNIDVS